MCGPLSYTSNRGALESIVFYNAKFKSFVMFTEKTELVKNSPYTYHISSELVNYPGYGLSTATGIINIIEGICTEPVLSSDEPKDIVYKYEGTAMFTFPTLKSDPAECAPTATYSCEYLGGEV